jgi:hypothetical protein
MAFQAIQPSNNDVEKAYETFAQKKTYAQAAAKHHDVGFLIRGRLTTFAPMFIPMPVFLVLYLGWIG